MFSKLLQNRRIIQRFPHQSFNRSFNKSSNKSFNRSFSTKKSSPSSSGKGWSYNDYMNEKLASLSNQINQAPTTKDIHSLFREMERRRYNTRRIKWIISGLGLSLIFLSAKQIKGFLSTQTSEVTTQSMDDPDFQQRVKELSTQVSYQVLHDLMDNEEMQVRLKGYTRDVLKDAVIELYGNPEFKKETQTMAAEIVTSQIVEQKSTEIAKKVAHQLVEDEDLQRKTGVLIKNATYYGFMPSYFTQKSDPDTEQLNP